MKNNSRSVVSNQEGIHENLMDVLARHQEHIYQKKITAHTQIAFEEAREKVEAMGKPLIFDSGCGTGESTIQLAEKFHDHLVLGIDKSAMRLEKAEGAFGGVELNFAFIRADFFDFWRLAAEAGWKVDRHYLLYPNPWPKAAHLKRRYHGHAAFFDLMKLGTYFEMRSNWKIYLEEFAKACEFATGKMGVVEVFEPDMFLTNFEAKYSSSGQEIYRFALQLNDE